MAKKNKKNSKINQRIRKYFDDDPFDVGIERVESKTLSELFAALGIYDIEHNKKLMIKTLRMIWSEAESTMRQDILHFFEADGRVYKSEKPKDEPHFNREEKIDAIIAELDVNDEEALRLREAFATVRAKKITIEKMESKLRHIHFELKKEKLERELEGIFDIDDSFEFNASLKYSLYDQSFHKILTLHTKPYSYELIEESDFDALAAKISEDKMQAVAAKQKSIDAFLASLKYPHAYLTTKEIIDSLRASPPKTTLAYPLISAKVLKKIVREKIEAKEIEVHSQELLIVVDEVLQLPYSSKELTYNLELSIELDGVLEEIWESKRFNFDAVRADVKKEYEESFLDALEALVEECRGYAELLHFSEEELHERIYAFLLDFMPRSLHLTQKIHRKVARRFLQSIQGELIKKQRQELLARTIRDFKNLFPIARGMRRKLTLHIGPTNSGKTYTAMKQLEEADTGYYLAPLRLLALEGYETLRSKGIDASLITGEEQILDEEATHISSTIEMMNYDVDVDVCVIDEVQMIDDRDRGWAWANAIIGAPAKEVIMTGSPNVKEAVIALADYLGEELEIIEFERKNPLELLEHPTDFKNIEAATAVIAFSRKDVLKLKQRLSADFNVSVVYGNLSPEVRREEARRFREGETEILVATDAIAMGMNLPIKTILFSKAEKFDGITQRNLFPSEILQIAGRAGRYGLHENGYVGALNKEALSILKKNFSKEPKKIGTPFKVMASLDHIKLVSSILEENSLEEILRFFIKNMEFNGPFYAASLDDMLEASRIVDSYDLDIATKYHLACAPLTLKSSYIIEAYESYIHALEKQEPVYYHPPKLQGVYAQTSDELLRAEDMVKEISLYLWLSYRFEDYFVDAEKARQYRGVLNRYIENTLQQTQLVQSCKLCSAPLPYNSKYAICQSCFKKHYTHRGRGQRRSPR
ncbi:SUV3 C-terminal domain-containing protein [Sulfurimonas paralvinellae]|uniref:Helicase n=1 Tax=Sulfurimonas paralvinellae TaxID=317658 RepID=A0A7M1BAC4_9BACT|nr:SUV3 C-terminal domain-containing protein [Sulfurimonas paralvinellae]QOP46669.1 helicase [Sulfurimonas paralvinellae]